MWKRKQLANAFALWDRLPPVASNVPAPLKSADAFAPGAATYDIVVPIYGAVSIVQPLLDRMAAHRSQNCRRLILVDDASDDPHLSKALETFAEKVSGVHLIQHDQNKGFSAAVTTGINASNTDYVLVLNSDTVPPKGSLDRLMIHLERDNKLATVCPLSNQAAFATVDTAQAGASMEIADIDNMDAARAQRSSASYPVPYTCGFCWGVRRAVWDQLNGFDPDFAGGYGEDADFSLRAHQLGWQNHVVTNAVVFHAHGQSFAQRRLFKERLSSTELIRRHPDFLQQSQSQEWLALAQEARS